MSNLEEENTATISAEMQFLMLAKDQSDDLEKQMGRLREKGIDDIYVDRLLTHLMNHIRLYERTAQRLAEENASHWEERLKNLKWLEGLGRPKE